MNLFRHRLKSPLSSPERFRTLYENNRLSVVRYIYGLTGGPQDEVEDLTAETFLRAWKARKQFQGEDAAATGWLIRIAKRLVIDNYRRTQQQNGNTRGDLWVESSPEQTAMQREQIDYLYHLLADLTEEQREIVVLRYLLGWRVIDIAHYTGQTENNISVTIHRTLSKLREKWVETYREGPETVVIQKETSHEIHSR